MSKQRILVVEDDSIFRNYLFQVLKYDYEVVAVVNPLEALSELGRSSFALMLTDLRMPEMDGRELVEKVHAEIDPNLMVIVITAFEGDWPIDNALASHIFRYLRKGAFLPSELKQNVAKAIEMQRSIVSLEEYRRREDSDIYRDAFNNAAAAFFITDSAGRFLTINQAFRRLSGYALEDLRDSGIGELLGEQPVRQMTSESLADFRPLAVELKLKSGGYLPVEVWLRPLSNLKDLPRAFGGSLSPLPDRPAAAQDLPQARLDALSAELAELKIRFARLNEHCHNLVLWLDRNWQCEFANSMVTNLLGYPELKGRRIDWASCVSPEDLGQLEAVKQAVKDHAPGYEGTLRLLDRNRHQFHLGFEVFCRYDETGAFAGTSQDQGLFQRQAGQIEFHPLFAPAQAGAHPVRLVINGAEAQPFWIETP